MTHEDWIFGTAFAVFIAAVLAVFIAAVLNAPDGRPAPASPSNSSTQEDDGGWDIDFDTDGSKPKRGGYKPKVKTK